ncbi:MAG: extracellular solute-binding protein [Bacteroidota bacterium]|nr:extracellular solute-binding protein [Bacteroidota bacterium]
MAPQTAMHIVGRVALGLLAPVAIVLLLWNPFAAEPVSDGRTHLQYWYIVGADDDVPPTVRRFNQIQDSIVVHATPIPWQEHEKKILTAVLSGDPPDVVSQFVPVVRWASRMALRPLDDLIKATDFDTTLFFPALWEEMTWQGRPFALPVNTASYAFFYNRKLFQEAGLEPDMPPATWQQVRQYSSELQRKSVEGYITQVGFLPLFSGSQQGLLGNISAAALIAWQKNVRYLHDEGTQVSLNNPALKEAFKWTANYYGDYSFEAVQAFIGGLGTGEQHGFLTEKVAMMMLDISFLDLIAQHRPDLDFGVVTIPSMDGSPTASVAGSWWLGMPRGVQHPEAAWAFMQFYVSRDMQLEEVATRDDPLFPANLQAAYDSSFISRPMMDVFVRQMDYAHSPTVVPLVHSLFWREFYGALERSVQRVQSPEEALIQAEQTIQSALDRAVRYDRYVRSRMMPLESH